jgi:YhcH/YjgK/YiaL family protein
MIHDFLLNWELYFPAHFEPIIQTINMNALEPKFGEFPVNDWAYAKIMNYRTKIGDHITESHQKWVDLHCIYTGLEQIDLFAASDLVIKRPYSIKDDCIFYKSNSSVVSRSSILLMPGMFGLFFPGDVHKTQIAVPDPSELVKIVIKIKYEFFTHK